MRSPIRLTLPSTRKFTPSSLPAARASKTPLAGRPLAIHDEELREYQFPSNGPVEEIVLVQKPLVLDRSRGAHRIVDAFGVSHYIPKGWIALRWKNSQGAFINF